MKSSGKTVYMVFNDKEKISVAGNLYANLKYVFEEYICVKTCFLDEIVGEDIADGDLFIVLYRDRVYAMRDTKEAVISNQLLHIARLLRALQEGRAAASVQRGSGFWMENKGGELWLT